MFKSKIIKKAFTLIEIILVVAIISIIYSLALDNFKFPTNIKKISIDIKNIPVYMKKFGANSKLVCIEDGKRCLVYDSENKITKEIKNLFLSKPIVYKYDKNLEEIYFADIELKHLDRFEVCFEYNIDKYNKSGDMIVEYDNKFYIFNSINNEVITLESSADIYDYFEDLNIEVKDAF